MKQVKFFCVMLLGSFLPMYCAEQEQLSLSIVITSYNNQERVQANLNSVFKQNYENYRVYYIDDASLDRTAEYVQTYLDEHKMFKGKCFFISNKVRQGKLKNLYNMIHALSDSTIVVQVDGDDELAHSQVFAKINEVYQSGDIWLTYGQCKSSNTDTLHAKAVPQKVVTAHAYREHSWVYCHLHTFYAWLFKSIKLADLLTDNTPLFAGMFHPAVDDVAFMTPMIEMTGGKFKFIDEILYIFYEENSQSHWRRMHKLCLIGTKEILSKPAYQPLENTVQYTDKVFNPALIIVNVPHHDRHFIHEYCAHLQMCLLDTDEPLSVYTQSYLDISAIKNKHKYVCCVQFGYIPEQPISLHKLCAVLHRTHSPVCYCMPFDNFDQMRLQPLSNDLATGKFSCNQILLSNLHVPMVLLDSAYFDVFIQQDFKSLQIAWFNQAAMLFNLNAAI